MCDATFTLGQRGSHFFQCPSRRDHTRIPKKLQRLLTSNDLAQIYHVTLGFENCFLITYRDRSGNDHIESQGLPDELNDFIYATNSQGIPLRLIPQIRVTLGPQNESFFVGDGSAYLWMNLPSRLLSALQSRIKNGSWVDKPRIVALGADENFLLITRNNAAVWDLEHYRTLSNMVEYSKTQDRGIEEVQNVVLHPYRYQGFIAQSRNGTLLFDNLPQWCVEGLGGMRGPISRDSREEDVRRRQRDLQMRPSLRERQSNLRPAATLRREWGKGEKEQHFKAQAKGLRLSLSLSIGVGGLTKILG